MLTVLTQPGRCFMGRLAKGEDLLAALERLCQEHGITLGEVRALGAVSRARVGFYNQEERKYYFLNFDQPLEILSLTGNVSMRDGKPMVHAHVTSASGWPGRGGAPGRGRPGLRLRVYHHRVPGGPDAQPAKRPGHRAHALAGELKQKDPLTSVLAPKGERRVRRGDAMGVTPPGSLPRR